MALTSTATADPTFYLPFPKGESYIVTNLHEGGDAQYMKYNQYAVDFRLPEGSTVLASAAGTVAYAGELDKLSGNTVLVNHGDNRCTQYIHLSKVLVEKDQKVRSGQKIALSGWSGTVVPAGPRGAHLHWNLVACDTHISLATVDTVEMGTNYPKGESAKSQNVLDEGQQDQEVTPGEVTFKDEPGTDADTYTIPKTKGVEYRIKDKVVDPGTYPGSGKVTVTARALDGYTLKKGSKTEWSKTFDDKSPTPTPSPSVTVSSTPSATATTTQTPSPSVTVSSTPSATATTTQTPSPSVTVSSTPSATATTTPTAEPTATANPTVTATVTTSPPVIGLPSTGW